jgi:hypothetical protein
LSSILSHLIDVLFFLENTWEGVAILPL